MKKNENSDRLTIIIAILIIVVFSGASMAIYSWRSTKVAESKKAQNLPKESPTKVVQTFMKQTLGTIPDAELNFDSARTLLIDDLKAKFGDDGSFGAKFYGIQERPSKVTVISEYISDDVASVKVNANWGEVGIGWAFSLIKIDNKWLISNFRNDAQ